MKVIIKKTIFDGTIFQDLPVNLKWQDTRPSHLYEVNGRTLTLYNHKQWVDINHFNTIDHLRDMFRHDLCHAFLYHIRREYNKINSSDFGLSWENVKIDEHGTSIFHNMEEYNDEIKIVALTFILRKLDNNECIEFKDYMEWMMKTLSYFHFHDKNHYTTESYKKKRERILNKGFLYWMDGGGFDHLYDKVIKFRKYLRTKYDH